MDTTAEAEKTVVGELQAELASLHAENARLRERLDALHQAAELWIQLYERQLARANALEAEAARQREPPPPAAVWPQPLVQRPVRMSLTLAVARRKATQR